MVLQTPYLSASPMPLGGSWRDRPAGIVGQRCALAEPLGLQACRVDTETDQCTEYASGALGRQFLVMRGCTGIVDVTFDRSFQRWLGAQQLVDLGDYRLRVGA
jgi:hypothetical protein